MGSTWRRNSLGERGGLGGGNDGDGGGLLAGRLLEGEGCGRVWKVFGGKGGGFGLEDMGVYAGGS